MQLIVNCLLIHENKGLFLLKPRRNWFVCPGGKMETYEHIEEAVIREYKEETNIDIVSPKLKAVTSHIYRENSEIQKQRMMFTFVATKHQGENWAACHEGTLSWIYLSEVLKQNMIAGDRMILSHILHGQGILSGVFTYNAQENLLEHCLSVMSD